MIVLRILLVIVIAAFLIRAGIIAIKNKEARFGRGYGHWKGRKAVYLGWTWILFGTLLLILGSIFVFRSY